MIKESDGVGFEKKSIHLSIRQRPKRSDSERGVHDGWEYATGGIGRSVRNQASRRQGNGGKEEKKEPREKKNCRI